VGGLKLAAGQAVRHQQQEPQHQRRTVRVQGSRLRHDGLVRRSGSWSDEDGQVQYARRHRLGCRLHDAEREVLQQTCAILSLTMVARFNGNLTTRAARRRQVRGCRCDRTVIVIQARNSKNIGLAPVSIDLSNGTTCCLRSAPAPSVIPLLGCHVFIPLVRAEESPDVVSGSESARAGIAPTRRTRREPPPRYVRQ